MSAERRPIPVLYIGIVMFALGLFVATLLHSGPLATSSDTVVPTADKPVLFTLSDRDITVADLSYESAAMLHRFERRVEDGRREVLRDIAWQQHLRTLAETAGRSPQELSAELLAVPETSDRAIERFYETNRSRIQQPLEEVRETIARMVQEEKRTRQRNELIDGLVRQGQLAFPAPRLSRPVAEFDLEGVPFRGSADAPVKVVEFADYRCPHCRRASASIAAVLEANPQGVQWFFIDFPILGNTSVALARGGWCAARQEQYWAWHDRVFAMQDDLNGVPPEKIAGGLDLDLDTFKSCLDSQSAAEQVQRATAQAQRLGLTGTPAVFINGLAYEDGDLEQDLKQAISSQIPAAVPQAVEP